MTCWKVYLKRKLIDKVFFNDTCDRWYVKHSLINHDGYNPNIKIVKERKKTHV